MTNHWIDLRNSDAVFAIGCNPAENHPISMKWIEAAMDGGGKLIVVDPRFTRTASKADLYAQIRPGTDIAFLGGMINYALQHDLIHHEYVREYTNASFIINEQYDFENGLFCGFDDQEKTYDLKTWAYETDAAGKPKTDKSLSHPRSVYQLMKKHFSRYDVEMVCSITGTPMEDYLAVTRTFCATGRPDRAGTILYAMGITQSTHGTQNVRAISILQTLLGNIGIAGGGINALRGESNVQGSTDYGLLFHILPGYLKSPEFDNADLKGYLEKWTPKSKDSRSANWWGNTAKYTVSLLKAWCGEHATKRKRLLLLVPAEAKRQLFLPETAGTDGEGGDGRAGLHGDEPRHGRARFLQGPRSTRQAEVAGDGRSVGDRNVDLLEASRGESRATYRPKSSCFPPPRRWRRKASISNSGRWAQWRYKAVEPVGRIPQ